MRNDPLYNRWRETGWRRKLTAEEEAGLSEWLSGHPEAQGDWECEAALNELLAGLPNAPLASNFTARVIQAAEGETLSSRRGKAVPRRHGAWWIRWIPKVALGAVIVAALISYNHIQSVERVERAQSLATLSQVASLPSPDVLNDFDAIAALSSTPPADDELLKIMQ